MFARLLLLLNLLFLATFFTLVFFTLELRRDLNLVVKVGALSWEG